MSATEESIDDYFARLNLEEKRTVWVENRTKVDYVYRKIKKYTKNGQTACEIGFGEGYLLRLLYNSGLKVVGIDVSKYLVNELRNRFDREGLDIKLIHGDISKIELEKDAYDFIFCLDVLEHIPDVKKAVENIKKGLANSGLLIGTLPFQEDLRLGMVMCPKCKHEFHRIGHHHSFNSLEEIKQLLGPEFRVFDIGEVKNFRNVSDIISHVIKKILRLASRNKGASSVYFAAKLDKDVMEKSEKRDNE